MKNCAVVIPFYKDSLTPWEQVSYARTVNILKGYDIFAVQPEGKSYHQLQDLSISNVSVVGFSAHYFSSIEGYNALMLSKDFYEAFKDYEFVLIVQLDALVLSNQLRFFLEKKWDYWGAPWVGFDICSNKKLVPYLPWYRQISWINRVLIKRGFWHVGNGGVSLRRVSRFIKVLDLNEKLGAYDLHQLPINEDNFWSFCANKIDPEFQVASFSDALKFAFETNPRMSFELNNKKLPFACHAFEKHDFNFWHETLDKMGINAKPEEQF